MADDKWRDIALNIPSLLPLQAPPQTQEDVINYLQALHNYLAGDRLKIARAINVISYFRTLMGTSWEKPQATGSGITYTATDTGEVTIDDPSPPDAIPTWGQVITSSKLLIGMTYVVAVPLMSPGGAAVILDDHVVVDELPGDTSAVDYPGSFLFDDDDDIVMSLEEVSL